jgi:hypothetical protein
VGRAPRSVGQSDAQCVAYLHRATLGNEPLDRRPVKVQASYSQRKRGLIER